MASAPLRLLGGETLEPDVFCRCDVPLPEPDTASCVKCGRSSVAALPVDPLDAELHKRRRNGYRLEVRDVEAHDRPEDCARACWRQGGDLSCTCDDFDEDGTTEGGW